MQMKGLPHYTWRLGVVHTAGLRRMVIVKHSSHPMLGGKYTRIILPRIHRTWRNDPAEFYMDR